MSELSIEIRPLQYDELPLLDGIPPPEWRLDIVTFFRTQYPEPYFHAVAAWTVGAVAGVGNVVINGTTGWLGNIIVPEPYRSRGIGRAVMEHLCRYCRARGCTSLQLIATELGLPLYVSMGFQVVEDYLFMSGGTAKQPEEQENITPARPEHWPFIEALDHLATGEDRGLLLRKFGSEAQVWQQNGQIRGFFLPKLGDGLIIADTLTAGTDLLAWKHSRTPGLNAGLPESNEAAVRFLQDMGYSTFRKAPRLFLDSDTKRRPEMIYSRIGGYVG